MKKVILQGLNKRGKDKINSYGSEFMMKTRPRKVPAWGDNMVLFESVNKNFRVGSQLTTWIGWLDLGIEVEIVEEKC